MAKGNENKYVYFFDLLTHSDGRTYVGSTSNIKKRFTAYKNCKDNRYVTNSIKKYGFNNFYKLIIDLGNISYKEMLLWEKFYISLFGTYNKTNENGMNLVANPSYAISKDPLVAKKISDAHKGKKLTIEHINAIKKGTKGIVNVGMKRPYLSERNKIIKPALGRHGEKHPMSKKVLYVPENKIFESITDCALYLNVSRPTIRNRVLANNINYKLIDGKS